MRAAIVALAIGLAGCAPFAAPTTFNGQVAYADGLAGAVGKTCLDLSKRDRIPVSTLIRCTSTVEQAGTMIDTARAVGATGGGEERLRAAQKLLLDMEADLKAREAK